MTTQETPQTPSVEQPQPAPVSSEKPGWLSEVGSATWNFLSGFGLKAASVLTFRSVPGINEMADSRLKQAERTMQSNGLAHMAYILTAGPLDFCSGAFDRFHSTFRGTTELDGARMAMEAHANKTDAELDGLGWSLASVITEPIGFVRGLFVDDGPQLLRHLNESGTCITNGDVENQGEQAIARAQEAQRPVGRV